MAMRWIGFGSLCLTTASLGQDGSVVPPEASPPVSLQAVAEPARSPAEHRLSPPSSLPEQASKPAVIEVERSGLQPLGSDSAMFGGHWVSPQLVLGSANGTARTETPELQEREMADDSMQPTASTWASRSAAGLNKRFEGKLVKRYAEARVVRFLAPRESLQNLFDEIGLDDLNRYQFRRNRPDSVPVERASE